MSTDWSRLVAPDLADFDALARAVFQVLPGPFRARCGAVVIRVEDFPSEEVCEAMGLESGYDLLGLYQGTDLTRKSVADSGSAPDMVFLYRRPLLDVWAEGEETLEALVAHVLIHEIGHHFGLSDNDMEAIEASVADQAGAAPSVSRAT